MVAARYPSPISSRPSNPNPKILRKSGSFDLSKPCSGSEIPHRSSNSKFLIGNRSSFEQKENQKDPKYSKPARTKSPAINPSKIMKSFMAPTISASSKIAAASPRKKILAERNLVARDCTENNIVSAEEVKGEEIRQNFETDYDSRSMKLDFGSSKGYEQLPVTRSLDAGASEDADPSLPPYDPMKNYLSPRPRFLHYQPNPRFEQNHEFMEDLLNVGEGRRLEDSFSDSEEDSEVSSGYTEQSSSMKDENLMNPQQVHVSDENHVFDSNPRAINYKPKPWSFGKFKLIPFLLAFSVLLFSVPLIDTPILSASNMKDQSLADPLTIPIRILQDIHLYDYLDVASRNLQGLATRMRQWSVDSIENLISSCSFSKDELSMSHSFNTTLTSLMVQSSPGLDFCSSSDVELAEKEIIVNRQNDLVDYMEMKFEVDMNDSETLQGNGKAAAEKFKVEFYENLNGDSTELAGWKMVDDSGDSEYDRINSLTDPAVQFGTINNSDQLEETEITISEEIGGEGYPAGFDMTEKLEEQVLMELEKDNIHPINKDEISSSTYSVDETQLANKTDFDDVPSIFSDYKFLVLGMFASMALAAKLISLFIKKKNTNRSFNEKPSNKKTRSVYEGTKSSKHASGDFYCNRVELAEMVCDSGPTEMSSSFDNNLSFLKSKMASHNVTPSSEISQRRESGVSSSISYGSFTSFERCSRKGNKKEQVLTPVRRSSRIQNQAS